MLEIGENDVYILTMWRALKKDNLPQSNQIIASPAFQFISL